MRLFSKGIPSGIYVEALQLNINISLSHPRCQGNGVLYGLYMSMCRQVFTLHKTLIKPLVVQTILTLFSDSLSDRMTRKFCSLKILLLLCNPSCLWRVYHHTAWCQCIQTVTPLVQIFWTLAVELESRLPIFFPHPSIVAYTAHPRDYHLMWHSEWWLNVIWSYCVTSVHALMMLKFAFVWTF